MNPIKYHFAFPGQQATYCAKDGKTIVLKEFIDRYNHAANMDDPDEFCIHCLIRLSRLERLGLLREFI